MLQITSLLMVFGYSIYFYLAYRSTIKNDNHYFSKCIPMVLGMTSSVTIGLVIAMWIPQMLAISTILSIILGIITSYLIGNGFGISGIIEAQASSYMGAMMGAMLGVMLSAQEMIAMVIAMDILYLISFYSMILLLTKELVVHRQEVIKSKSVYFYLTFLLSLVVIGSMGVLQIDFSTGEPDTVVHSHHH